MRDLLNITDLVKAHVAATGIPALLVRTSNEGSAMRVDDEGLRSLWETVRDQLKSDDMAVVQYLGDDDLNDAFERLKADQGPRDQSPLTWRADAYFSDGRDEAIHTPGW